jgi:hypothetical protein
MTFTISTGASLSLIYGNKITPINPTIPGSAITYAGYAGQIFSVKLIAHAASGESMIPPPEDISWAIQNTTVAKLSGQNGLENSIILGPSRGETVVTVTWQKQNIKGTIKVITVAYTSQTTVTYDDGTILGQLIRLVSEPTELSPNDPAGRTKIYIVKDGMPPSISDLNTVTAKSKLTPRGSIIEMSDALHIAGDGLVPIDIHSNVGDPINVRKTLSFKNHTINVPIQVTIKVADYFTIITPFGELKNYNFVVEPQQTVQVIYGINKNVVKTMIPNVYKNPIKISAVSMDSGQIFLE